MAELVDGTIVPEDINEDNPNYAPGHWNYRLRCADVDLAMGDTWDRVSEWSYEEDPHGWWHERTHLIALYNEIVRLRRELGWTGADD